MILSVVKHYTSILYEFDSDIDQCFFYHLRLYYHSDLSGDVEDLLNLIETVTMKYSLDDSSTSIFMDFFIFLRQLCK